MKSNNYKAVVNESFEFENLSQASLDVIPDGENRFHILKNGKSYQAELLEADDRHKRMVLKINGNIYKVELSDQYDQLVKKLGLSANTNQKIKSINAPMPGLVLEITAKAGQEICKGDPLLILEAMKMENVIKSPGDGVIKEIAVEKGAAVEKGQLLIELE